MQVSNQIASQVGSQVVNNNHYTVTHHYHMSADSNSSNQSIHAAQSSGPRRLDENIGLVAGGKTETLDDLDTEISKHPESNNTSINNG